MSTKFCHEEQTKSIDKVSAYAQELPMYEAERMFEIGVFPCHKFPSLFYD